MKKIFLSILLIQCISLVGITAEDLYDNSAYFTHTIYGLRVNAR